MPLVFVLSNKYISQSGYLKNCFHGIGDILNGIAYCMDYCEQHGLDFKIGFHPDSPYFNILNFKNFFYGITSVVPKFVSDIEEIEHSSDKFIFTNSPKSFDINKSSFFTKTFIKQVFLNIKNPKYKNILHIRSGDSCFVDKTFLNDFYLSDNSHPFSPYDYGNLLSLNDKIKIIMDYLEYECLLNSFDLIISDDFYMKNDLALKLNCDIESFRPFHSGLPNVDLNSLFETLHDLSCIFYCENLLSISSFPFGVRASNFAYVPATLGGVNAKYAFLNLFEKKILDIHPQIR